jgi:hypothetical protein
MVDCDWYDKDGRPALAFSCMCGFGRRGKGLTEITYFISLVCWDLLRTSKDRPLIGRSLDVVWDLVLMICPQNSNERLGVRVHRVAEEFYGAISW